MNTPDPKEERWIAYYLNELSPAERREVESEIKASPQAAEEYERLVRGIALWAAEPVPYTPLNTESLGIGPLSERASARSGRLNWLRPKPWVWGLASAALLMVLFGQAEFTFRLGRVDLRWGAPAADPETAQLRNEVNRLTAQLAGVTQSIDEQDKLIRDVAYTSSLQDAMIENQLSNATAQLVRFVQSESQTRYQDFQSFLQLAGLNDAITPEWMLESSTTPATQTSTQENPNQ